MANPIKPSWRCYLRGNLRIEDERLPLSCEWQDKPRNVILFQLIVNTVPVTKRLTWGGCCEPEYESSRSQCTFTNFPVQHVNHIINIMPRIKRYVVSGVSPIFGIFLPVWKGSLWVILPELGSFCSIRPFNLFNSWRRSVGCREVDVAIETKSVRWNQRSRNRLGSATRNIDATGIICTRYSNTLSEIGENRTRY